MAEGILEALIAANEKRQQEWDPEEKLTMLFHSNAMGGECGEAQNVVKKLEREALGLPGSRATPDDVGDEIADMIIYAVNVCRRAGVDLPDALRRVFNAKSEQLGFETKI